MTQSHRPGSFIQQCNLGVPALNEHLRTLDGCPHTAAHIQWLRNDLLLADTGQQHQFFNDRIDLIPGLNNDAQCFGYLPRRHIFAVFEQQFSKAHDHTERAFEIVRHSMRKGIQFGVLRCQLLSILAQRFLRLLALANIFFDGDVVGDLPMVVVDG